MRWIASALRLLSTAHQRCISGRVRSNHRRSTKVFSRSPDLNRPLALLEVGSATGKATLPLAVLASGSRLWNPVQPSPKAALREAW